MTDQTRRQVATVQKGLHHAGEFVELHCSNCKAAYSASEPTVQRGLKQAVSLTRAKGSSDTPKLCWVCRRLHISAREVFTMQDQFYNRLFGGD